MDLKSLWNRFVEFAACLMALGAGLLVTGFAETVILVAVGRATGGRMEIVEPILWAVCVVLVVLAGATWRNAWREFRSRG